MLKLRSTIFAAALLALSASPAIAQPIPAAGLGLQDVQSWLTAKSLSATIKKDSSGRDIVTVSGPINWDVYFFNCDKGTPYRCRSIQFAAGWTGTYTADQANARDREWRTLRVYTTEDGKAIWGEHDILLAHDMSYAALDEHLAEWQTRIGDFADYLTPKKDK